MNTRTMSATGYDAGLRSYLSSIYNWMILGMLTSAGAAYLSTATGLVDTLKTGGVLFWLVALAPFALILFMAAATAGAVAVSALAIAFLAFTGLEGLSLSVVLTRYTGTNVAMAFLASAATFAGMSLWGYTTKRNLTGMGNFFLGALIGLIAALVLNIIFPMTMFNLLVSIAGVVIFAGLVAYDTQVMRDNYTPGDSDANARFAIWHALDLYLDFLNLLLFFLRFMQSDD